jgi:hypothetical protein
MGKTFNGGQRGYFNGDNARAAAEAAAEAGRKASELRHLVFVQQGNYQFMQFSDQKMYNVVREVWQGSGLLDVALHGSYHTREEAEARVAEVEREYA